MNKTTFHLIAGLAAICTILSSCSSVQQSTAFTKRKYFNFKRHNPVVAFNRTIPGKERTNVISHRQSMASSANLQQKATNTIPNGSISQNSCSIIKSQKHHSSHGITQAKSNIAIAAKSGQETVSRVVPGPTSESSSANTSGGGSSIDPVVLILLAIVLSPLAVYLHDNAPTTRFWIDLILWVLGVGALGFFYFFGLLWLAAVVYAILIVTGHA